MGGAPKWSKLALLVLKPLVTWGSTVVGKPHVWRMSEHGLWAWGNIYIHRNEITLCDIEVYELYKYHVHYECIILHMFVCTHIYHISWMYSISCCVQSAFESIYEFQHVHSHKMSVQGARYDVQYICLSLSYVLWQVCVSPVRALLNFATIHRHGQTERERERESEGEREPTPPMLKCTELLQKQLWYLKLVHEIALTCTREFSSILTSRGSPKFKKPKKFRA